LAAYHESISTVRNGIFFVQSRYQKFPERDRVCFCPLLRDKYPIINQLKLISIGVDINTSDNADAFDNGFVIARILTAHQFDGKRIIFISDGIIKKQVAVFAKHDRIFDLLPNKTRFEIVLPQKTVQLVVTKPL
jgi:hypothetical protein